MALAAKLQLRQAQSLVMTPQLLQSIRLLQLTRLELDRFIDEEIERNPLLERADGAENASDGPSEPFAADDAPPVAAPAIGEEIAWTAESLADQLDTSLENIFPDDPGVPSHVDPTLSAQWRSAGGATGIGTSPSDAGFEELAGGTPTLRSHVEAQIALAFRDRVQTAIAHELADRLDENGYLDASPTDIAADLGIARRQVDAVLQVCQSFDPPGLFARGLGECLALQLRARDRFDPAMQALLAHLDLLAKRDFEALRRICRVDEADLLDMLGEIRALDPRPGLAFTGGSSEIVVPDILVRAASDGSWSVELNPDVLPRVLVDQSYYAHVSRHARSPADKAFLSECLQSANWLTRSLDQRARTILKVATEIVRQQDAFLVHGVRHLRPLNLRTVADAIGMHESTVSRVTANKYMLTPRGVFELRYFFTAAIGSAAGGDSHSSEAVRDRIRQLIEEEQPGKILSDDTLVDLLRKTGVDIARRTVAKYREGMNIPSSVQRRREKRARLRSAAE
ncbi:RNA polymerase factor sigma-54 [Tianweitania sediminis]|uniref:RNA polymerase sigma-54 factor n=1 Tax=Tianweitania sediminis TaxID=1502156 RepID=A0A8J7R3B7_9HYPH|nr:RNA polymerase factor sigma-54 [Tianweitania sediminis]MBP0441080.1 RNA polymerase factor sigma-54 [Tianweitania sediminis]